METTINVFFPSSLLTPAAEMDSREHTELFMFGILAQMQNGQFRNLSKMDR